MSSNPLVPQPPTLLGNKTQNPTNFNDICQETNTQTEEKKPSVILCHYCFKEQKDYLICKQCKNNFCIDCFNEINKKEKNQTPPPPKDEEKENWICFACTGVCPCKTCSLIKKDKKEKKCLLCKAKTNLIKIDEMIQKLNLTEKAIEDYINQHTSVSLLLQDNNGEDKNICKSCFNSNYLVNKFLRGEEINLQSQTPSVILSQLQNQSQPQLSLKTINNTINNLPNIDGKVIPTEKKEDHTNKKISIPNQVPIDPQNKNLNFGSILGNQPQLQIPPQKNVLNDFQNKNEPLGNINSDILQQQFPNMGFPQGFPPGNPMSQLFMLPQQGQTPPQNLTASFAKIAESLQNFNNHNLQNNYNVLSNVNKFTELLSSMLEQKDKENDDKNGVFNKETSASMMRYLMEVIEDLKKQITAIQYYTQMQKYFIAYIMKNLESFMDQVNCQQVSNQQMMNDYQKNSLLQNPNIPLPMPGQNPGMMMNDMMKPMNMPVLMNPMQGGLMGIPGIGNLGPISPMGMPNLNSNQNSQQDKKNNQNKMNSIPMMMGQGMNLPGMMPNEPLNPNIVEMMKKMNEQNIMLAQGGPQMPKMNPLMQGGNPQMGIMPPQMDMGINPQGFNSLMFNPQRQMPPNPQMPGGFLDVFGEGMKEGQNMPNLPNMQGMPGNINPGAPYNPGMMNPDPMLIQMLMNRSNINIKDQNDKNTNNNKDN